MDSDDTTAIGHGLPVARTSAFHAMMMRAAGCSVEMTLCATFRVDSFMFARGIETASLQNCPILGTRVLEDWVASADKTAAKKAEEAVICRTVS